MSRSSRARRAKARAKKYGINHGTVGSTGDSTQAQSFVLSKTDKRYLIAFAVLSLFITAIYWSMGGRNLFVFPALLCISVGARKYWAGPIRRFADPTQ